MHVTNVVAILDFSLVISLNDVADCVTTAVTTDTPSETR